MRVSSPVVYMGQFLLLMLLAGCQQHQEVSDIAANTISASVQAQSITPEEDKSLFTVWGYAEPRNGESRGAERNFMEMSARASAQQMLTLAAGVSVKNGGSGLDVSGGSMVSMVVRNTQTTASNCLVQASGPVIASVPEGMKKIKTISGAAPLAKSKFMHELLKSAKTIFSEIKTNDSANTDGFMILRKMELIEGKEPPECRYELDVYAKE